MRKVSKYFLTLIYFPFSFSFAQNADSLISLASKMKADTNKVNMFVKIARSFYTVKNNRDFYKTVDYGKLARELSKKLGFKAGEAKGLNSITVGYACKNEPQKALLYLDTALKCINDKGNKTILMNIYVNRGLVYDTLMMHKESIKNYEKAVKYAKEVKDYEVLFGLYYSLGRVYAKFNKVNEKNGVPEKVKMKETFEYFDLSQGIRQKHKVSGRPSTYQG
ncbi:MAG TPA: tetratricopeptide repeat protein [Bacteroidia bacterium]|jgi:two-component system NarL family sensor kinase|nr:tetratricopeptide repeat protein [Bacteroidia bacterium]